MSQFAHVAVRSCLRSRVIMNIVESGVDGYGSRKLQHYQHCWLWFPVCVCSGVITLLAQFLYLPCGSAFVSSMRQCISADKLQHGSASIDYRPSIAHTFVRQINCNMVRHLSTIVRVSHICLFDHPEYRAQQCPGRGSLRIIAS